MEIEKTVFISYRHTNAMHARAIFQHLHTHGYDVFLDSESIGSGDFEQIILGQIKARAHFLVILTPSALENCSNPQDWLRREIETALDSRRNIVPLVFDGFSFKDVEGALVGKLALVKKYQALPIYSEYFDAAMDRLCNQRLNTSLDMILHPTPDAERKIVEHIIQNETAQPQVTEDQLGAGEYFERGLNASLLHDYKFAIYCYNEAIRLNSQYVYAYVNRGAIHNKLNQFRTAIIDFNKSIEIEPNLTVAYINRGISKTALKKYEQAIDDFNKALEIDPTIEPSRVYCGRGIAYASKGDYEHALVDFNKALEIDPNYAAAYTNRGSLYLDKGKYDNAISDCTKALDIDPKSSDAYNNRAVAYYHIGAYPQAFVDYKNALKFNPNHEHARKGLKILEDHWPG
jgi:tetratricopeptide (TPR) repeat protein